MKLDIDAFIAGISERLEFAKTADLFEQGQSSFFPMLQSQATWKYSKHGDKLHLHDGQHVYTFSFPAEIGDEDFPSERLEDSNHAEFEKLPHKGIAQVHRADPGSIYVTLQDGLNNPTFTLQHQSQSSWKGIPKKRLKKIIPETTTTAEVEPKQFLDGAVKEAEDFLHGLDLAAGRGVDDLGHAAYSSFANAGQDPLGAVLRAGGAYLGFEALKNLSQHHSPFSGVNLAKPLIGGLGASALSRGMLKVPGAY